MSDPYPCTLTTFDPDTDAEELVTSRVVAVAAAALISPNPELTRAVDPAYGLWEVWLPDSITEYAASGLDIDIRAGAFRIQCDMDPL